MAAPIPPVLKYSSVHNFINSPPILTKVVPKFIDLKGFYFKAQHFLKLRYPLINAEHSFIV